MNMETIKAAGDAINRVLKDEPIQPGDMIQYLEEKHQCLLVAGLDLKHEMSVPGLRSFEPGFYEKLFAELDAEIDMVKSIIAKLRGDQHIEEISVGALKRMADIRESMKGGV